MGADMIGVIDKLSRQLVCIVYSSSGHDAAAYDFVAAPDDPQNWAWDVATETFVPRPPTNREVTEQSLANDPRWQVTLSASPDQIEAWLNANVTDLASARRVLKILVMAIQLAMRSR